MTSEHHGHPRRTIAWLLRGDEAYGPRRMAANLSEAVREAGANPVFIALEDGDFAEERRRLGFEVRVLRVGRPRSYSGSLARKLRIHLELEAYKRRVAPRIAEAIRELRADALHFIYASYFPFASKAAQLAGVPGLWEMPNDVGGGYPFGINRRLYHRQCAARGIVAMPISRHTAGTLGAGPATVEICPLSVDPRLFDPATVEPVRRGDLGIPHEATVFAVCARLVEDKGQAVLLEAMLRIGDPSLHLLLLGGPLDGPLAARLRTMAAAAGADSRVHLLGPVSDPQRYYPLVDVAVNSRLVPEPFGLSVVEAMMMAKPVLVHALGGPAETVVDGECGWHLRDPSVAGFEQALRRALADRAAWQAMGEAARTRALAEYSSQAHARRHLAIVERAIARS
jgi:glycosyltransferase involved in cell wall biosynthesis